MSVLAVGGWLAALALVVAVCRLYGRLELVARAEHELRGPLTALSLSLASLSRQPAGRYAAELLAPELDRLGLAIDDLGAARRGGRARPRVATVALEPLVRRAAAPWQEAARRAGTGMRLDWRAGPVSVTGDRRRLAQALSNVVANAIEHGGGDIELLARRERGLVQMQVRDSGNGFSGGRRSCAPGSNGGPAGPAADRGRGLSIARTALEEAGGRLTVASGDHGAAVTLELPVADDL